MADPSPAEGLQLDTRQPDTRKYGIDNANSCSYNENSRCGQTGDNHMEREQAAALIKGLTYEEKLLLRELLLSLKQNLQHEESPPESDQKAS